MQHHEEREDRGYGRPGWLERAYGASNPSHPESGFSLLELLVVLTILVLLATITVPQVMKYLDKAKADTARVAINNMGATLDMFRLDVGRYPSQSEGLEALITQPSQAPGWNGPYLKRKDMLLDPWGRAYRYKFPGEHGEYDLYSYGADDAEGGEGANRDITSW